MLNRLLRGCACATALSALAACKDKAPAKASDSAQVTVGAAPTSDDSSADRLRAEDRQNGIDFRAVGQEPGWFMTVDDQHEIIFSADYMERTATFPSPPPPTHDAADGTITYAARVGEHRLRAVLVPTPCQDIMSGRMFDFTVTATFDGTVYSGCGSVP